VYEDLRSRDLRQVLAGLGFDGPWKERKDGTEWFGKCPIHGARNNATSFSFNVAGTFHCFSCGAKGKGSIDAVIAVRQCGFQEAVKLLKGMDHALEANRSPDGVSHLPKPGRIPDSRDAHGKEDEKEAEGATENPPFKATYEKYFKPHPWLEARGLQPETLTLYESGYYDNPARRSVYRGSVMLRISRYSDGECVGYLSRNIGDITPERPKYSLPKGFQKSLEVWGAHQLKDDEKKLRVVYVVESPFTVMRFHQLGVPAVSLLGWAVSPQQLDILADLAKGVVYLPNADKRKEAQAYAGLLATRLWVKFPEMPVADPEQLTAEQIRNLA
jgi:DNA primase